MDRDEARKLVGGYATGSLTDAERQALFAAALDDQDLFDELADEQSLKELLDEPGVRGRLIAGLTPQVEKRRWNLPWVGVGAALAGCAAVAIFWLNMPKPQNAEMIAKIELPSPRTAPAPPTFDERPSVTPTPAAPAPPDVRAAENVSPSQPRQQEKRFANRPTVVGSISSPTAAKSASNRSDAPATAAEAPVLKAENAPAPPVPAPSIFGPLVAPRAQRAKVAPVGAPGPTAAEQVQVATAQAPAAPMSVADAARSGFAAGGGGGRGGARAGFVQQQTFGFRYQVNDTFLQVTPTSIGWLTVTTADATPVTLFSNRMVPSGTPLAIPVPADVKELTIQFSAQAGLVSSVPQRRTALNGAVAADSEVAITIPARP